MSGVLAAIALSALANALIAVDFLLFDAGDVTGTAALPPMHVMVAVIAATAYRRVMPLPSAG
ncbi:hypothetical protein [Streptomyces coffeae]|uniref:Uncharacterized protein n=1 Tax=Streptomyces coffeae TaxID=621382 RepID=A0ABS1NQ35_9ACTN|nr:hypothetical protein [Streptomyces coffeae]MBL1102182.1 hypothetical protein [Streptomyces coffeae]